MSDTRVPEQLSLPLGTDDHLTARVRGAGPENTAKSTGGNSEAAIESISRTGKLWQSIWPLQPIESLCDINPESLGTATSSDYEFRYLDISAVEKGRISLAEMPILKFKDAPSRARRVVRHSDVLLCTVRPGLQSHAMIRGEQDDTLVCSTGFAVLRAKETTEPSFIFHQLFSNGVSTQLRAFETGSNYPAVNEGDVKRVLVPAPDRAEQSRIAAELDTVDEAIAKTEAVIAKLKQVRAGLLHDLLTCGLDENGQFRDPIAHPEQFQDSPLGRIPKEWEVVHVEEAGEVRLGRQRSPAHETGMYMRPYLRVANVFDGFIDYSDILWMNFDPSEQAVYNLKPGDILLNEGQSLELVGRSAIFLGLSDVYCFQNTLVRFRCNSTATPEYCQAVFKYWLDTRRFTYIAKQTTSVAHLGADRFAKMPFPRPKPDEQQRIADCLIAQDRLIEAETHQLTKLQQLKSGLMTDLLTGRVRVPEGITVAS